MTPDDLRASEGDWWMPDGRIDPETCFYEYANHATTERLSVLPTERHCGLPFLPVRSLRSTRRRV